MIFGLKDQLLDKEESVAEDEKCFKKLFEAMDLPNASLNIKEAKTISRYKQDIKGKPQRNTSSISCVATKY